MIRPQVALSRDFLDAFSRLPKAQQKKVREFTEKFQKDPTQPGINFERIEEARDPKVRSVRIDQAYRAIIVHPPKGDVYVCVWVDRHDDAYRWVRDKCFEVNPRSGAFQLFDVQEATEGPQPSEQVEPAPAAPAALFQSIDDEDILLAGVPAPLLASVRALKNEADLDALEPHLPRDCADVLYLLAAGYDLVQAIEESARSRPEPGTVDTEDFRAALEKPESQQTFKVVSDEDELERMLDAPLEQWRIFLHPSQRKLVEMNANGPVRVLGSAGTGKTVVLMHRAKHLATSVFAGRDDRIFVTTFTRNLALDLQQNIKNLCGNAMGRLDVMNLHSWAVQFMRRQGHEFRIAGDEERRELFDRAMAEADANGFSRSFYEEEWTRVVQDQDVETRDDYLTARRTGRGTRLSRPQRAVVWKVLGRYRELLQEAGNVEWPDVVRETRLFIEKQNLDPGYRAVLADEVQDFNSGDLRLLRRIAREGPNTLFLVGDAHQRIYGQPIRLSRCGIEVRGRSRRLRLNYRTTEEIRNRAIAILEKREIDDLDGGIDILKGYRSLRHGPTPSIRHFARENEEAEFIVGRIRQWLTQAPAENICVAARTRALLKDRYERILASAGIDAVVVEKDPESEARRPGVRLATMHRMKGLEFSKVLLAGVQQGVVPLEISDLPDQASRDYHELQERCLLYVGLTRARDDVVIVGFGEPSPFLAAATA